jgi:myo-inositol-1(or 4)-monophosphatase
MSEFSSTCEKAARAGGRVLLDWMGRFSVREKGPADLVTDADHASQEVIRQILLGDFPDHDFVGEEDGADSEPRADQAEYCWIVDPLDGTTNYVHAAPQFSVSVALAHQGRIVEAVVYDPTADECFAASQGEGANLNGQPIRVSEIQDLSGALVAASFSAGLRGEGPEIERFLAVLPRCQALRRMGSAALNLAYIATGRFDAYWATSTKSWDIAAGVLLVSEAGGLVTAVDGGPLELSTGQFAAASTEALHRQLVDILSESGSDG